MTAPPGFTETPAYGHYRPAGEVTYAQAVELLLGAIAHARAAGISRLLMDATALTFTTSPSLVDRMGMGQRVATTGQGQVRLAVIAPAHLMDPQKFGAVVAMNRGQPVDIFADEPSAIAWLTSDAPPSR
ncbi:MAG TPA: hypothetical protein VFS07_01750 [Gemmatimonadales bacterium]|nr:hypothetical protein [Gemmatimonadales bacterium]